MAKLYFKYGAMGSSKTAQALITQFNYEELGMKVWLIKPSTDTRDGAERMQEQYADLAYKCGMYHQLGKALVPPEYQLWQDDFTDEEKAVYKKYTTDGLQLVISLQERSNRANEKRRGILRDLFSKNIPWLMLRESCQQHMERFDGSGYPAGLKGSVISPIAQIVGIAKELDRLSAETPSENPFDEAYNQLILQAGQLWHPGLVAVLRNARSQCRAIYNKYIHYTQTLPKTVPLVEKRKDRAMGLLYRPMVGQVNGKPTGYEAEPFFGGIPDRPGETESLQDVEALLERREMVADITFYFLYEAADTVLRLENCKLENRAVLLPVMPAFYKLGSQLQRFNQLFKDQPIPRKSLLLTIPTELIANTTKATLETVVRYLRNGICLVADGYTPEKLPIETLKEIGFTYARPDKSLYLKQEGANVFARMRQEGFTLLASAVDSNDALVWLSACGVSHIGGPQTGVPVSEDEIIREALAGEK